MPRLFYPIEFAAVPLELAGQAVAALRVQDFARRNDLTVQEQQTTSHRFFVLNVPADRMNDILWNLDLAGLIRPKQTITGTSADHSKLDKQFSWLQWEDAGT